MNTSTDLQGKRALVTGASGALGAAIARRLAADGAQLLLHGHSRADALHALVDEISAAGGSAEAWLFDLSDDDATRQACEKMLAAGAVQVIVNNAGIHDDAVFPGMRAAQWYGVIDLSLHGFFRVTQPLLLPMLRTRWGRVVAVSSVAGIMGNRGQANYAAAKAGLHGAVKSLAIEVASRGVTANAVAPGIIDSPMSKRAFSADEIARLVPMKRAGTPQEVAAVVGFLCSEEAAYLSGQVIAVDGALA
jgi:3-oxoacyl-[acyl-carrier protein] reductase